MISGGDKTHVTFNGKAVESIKNSAENAERLDLQVRIGTTPADANKAAFAAVLEGKKEGSALVVSLTLINNEQKAVFAEANDGAHALVSVPYAVSGNDKLVVYYLNGDKLDKLSEDCISYKDGVVTLKLAHFSEYLLTTETPGQCNSDQSSPMTYDAGIAIYGMSAVLSISGMAWLGLKKRK